MKFFKKEMTLSADLFSNLRLQKMWLDKCLKSPNSEDPLTSDMLNGPKHCWNLNDNNFTIFIDPCEGISAPKSLSD